MLEEFKIRFTRLFEFLHFVSTYIIVGAIISYGLHYVLPGWEYPFFYTSLCFTLIWYKEKKINKMAARDILQMYARKIFWCLVISILMLTVFLAVVYGLHNYLPEWELPFIYSFFIFLVVVIVLYLEQKRFQSLKNFWDQVWEVVFGRGK